MKKIQRFTKVTTGLAVVVLGTAGFGIGARAAPTPEVRIKASRVVGDVASSTSVKKAVTAGKASLVACYKTDLTTHAGEVGELALSVRVEPTGKVSTIKVVRSAINSDLQKCVFKAIRAWTFGGWKSKYRQFASVGLVFQLAGKKPKGAYIRGGVPARLIAGTIQSRLPGLLKTCVKSAAPKRRRWPPKLTIIVDYDGTVQTATVSGRLPKRAMRKCITDHVKLWDFPPPDNGHRTWVYWRLQLKAPTK